MLTRYFQDSMTNLKTQQSLINFDSIFSGFDDQLEDPACDRDLEAGRDRADAELRQVSSLQDRKRKTGTGKNHHRL